MSETATYEREAAVTRERMAATIDDLQARLSPKALLDSAVDQLNATGAQALASVRGAAMGHPVAIAAAGIVIGIALLARRKVRSATIEYGDSYAAYADYDDGYAADLAADDIPPGPVAARIDAIQHRAHVAADGKPLAVVLIGVAAGAVLGALIPVSRAEHDLLGDVGLRLEAAGEAALDAAKAELDISKFSFAGGTAGVADRAIQSLLAVLDAAGTALVRRSSRTA
jgi:hypothetical protein